MKTKRLKKLLMGMGLSRNQVNHMVHDQRMNGSPKICNADYYHVAKSSLGDPRSRELLPCVRRLTIT